MTLYTSDYLEYYLTLVGWIIYDGLWNVLVASGIVALPFLVIVLQEWLRSRTEGADEGNKGVVSSMRIENRVWVAIVVIMFAGIPFIRIDLRTIQFDRTRSLQCQVTLALPAETGWEPVFTELNNQTAQVPVWWFFVHALSKAITGAASASIPCGTDLRQMRIEIASTRIDDPLLSQEVADFTRECYGLARARLFAGRPTLSDGEMNDVTWIGSRYFVDTPGFYDAYYSRSPRAAWPYDPVRDAGRAEVPSGGGYPSCEQWWSDSAEGLRARLLTQVEPDLLLRFRRWAGFLSQDEVDDAVIRAVASPRQQVASQGQVYTDYGGRIGMTVPNLATRIAADLGIMIGALGYVPASDAMRQALPMVLSLLKMALVICVPLVLVVSTFELRTVAIVSCVEFAVFFVDFWFQAARWIDSTLMDALYGWDAPHSNFNALLGLNNTFQDMIVNWFVTPVMFLVLPSLWITALTWTGIYAGNVLQGLADGTRAAGSAGSQGASTVLRAATARIDERSSKK
jgi:TraG-like protein, N-terminal region